MATNQHNSNVWPTFRVRDARAEIKFLQEAFGFEVAAQYSNADNPELIDHAELMWPEGGGGVMLGSRRDEGVMTNTGVGAASIYIATQKVEELYHRAIAAGATEIMGLTEQDYGSLDFSVQDPEGVLWSFGTYRGAQESTAAQG
ncbi:MAG: VOC family protein [Galactobacter sp.]